MEPKIETRQQAIDTILDTLENQGFEPVKIELRDRLPGEDTATLSVQFLAEGRLYELKADERYGHAMYTIPSDLRAMTLYICERIEEIKAAFSGNEGGAADKVAPEKSGWASRPWWEQKLHEGNGERCFDINVWSRTGTIAPTSNRRGPFPTEDDPPKFIRLLFPGAQLGLEGCVRLSVVEEIFREAADRARSRGASSASVSSCSKKTCDDFS